MYSFEEYYVAKSPADAYAKLLENPKNALLGGGAFLRFENRQLHTAIDISQLGLNHIYDDGDELVIGATVTYRELETNPRLQDLAQGVLKRAVYDIVGTQFRNEVQVGASVFGRYGFSDLLPTLIALRAEIVFFNAGHMPVATYAQGASVRDLITEIRIPDATQPRFAVFDCVRINAGDLPIVNMALAYEPAYGLQVAVGSLPGRARLLEDCSKALHEFLVKTTARFWESEAVKACLSGTASWDDFLAEFEVQGLENYAEQDDLNAAWLSITEDLAKQTIGTNPKASADYRRQACQAMIERGIEKAWKKSVVAAVSEKRGLSGKEVTKEGLRHPVVNDPATIKEGPQDGFIRFTLNGRPVVTHAWPNEDLFTMLRRNNIYSVKCGCETSNCGLCTVSIDGIPHLSCTVHAYRVHGKDVRTLEGEREEALRFGRLLAKQGAEQCGFCSPGFIMNVIHLKRINPTATDDEIRTHLMGNLCRCTGYQGQLRAIKAYLKGEEA